MSISLYLLYNDYKKEICFNLNKQIIKACCSIKKDNIDKCTKLIDDYKKLCIVNKK